MVRKHGRRVVVIGAGPGGLASAMLLAARGCQVQVFERLPHVGGRTSAWNANGFRFDLGPTFFLYPRVLREIFAEAGLDLDDEVPMKRLDPQYRLVFGQGGKMDCRPEVDRLAAEVAQISKSDAGQVARFLSENRTKFECFRPFLESPFSSWTQLLQPKLARLLPLLRPWNSLDKELGRYFKDPRIRLAFSFQSKYLGMSPFQCPSLFSILSFLEYEFGVFHPIGGCGRVSEVMADACQRLGVQFHLGQAVTSIDFEGSRATGVNTAKERFECDALVVNADFARAMQSLTPDHLRSRWTNGRLEKKKYSCSTYMLYLGVEGECPELPHHTIYLSKGYMENLKDIEQRHVVSADPSIYVQNACVTDAGLAPPGCSTLYILAPVTHQTGSVDWVKSAAPFREVVLNQLQKLGMPDIRGRIRYERMITPRDWDQEYNIYRGATFNLAHSLDQMLHLRPNNRFEDIDGVYLVGGGTHPGSGLPVIYSSARITSDLICQDLGVAYSPPAFPPNSPIRRNTAASSYPANDIADQETCKML